MTFTADTTQVDTLTAGLAEAAAQLRDPTVLMRRAGDEVARLAGPRTPRRTGRLAGSLTIVTDTDDRGGQARLAWGVPYAVPVNFGTRRMVARPFATDALEAAQGAIEAATLTWADQILEAV